MEQNSAQPQLSQYPADSEPVALCVRVFPAAQNPELQLRALNDYAGERTLIRERSLAGQMRYRRDFEAGRVGTTVHSRSGRDLPPHRPKRIFDREAVVALRRQGLPLRAIARRLGLGLGTVTRTLNERSGTP